MNNTSDRKLAAIMFADIVSYSRLMGTNETEALKLLKDFENISNPIVDKFTGSIIKKNGDQIFCEFASAKNAVDASLKLQNKLGQYNDSRPKDFKLEIRIGIHIGDIVKREDGDIHGDGVNVAARIQPLASPGGICISGAVSESLSSHPNYDIISKGERELKNILQKHSIFQVKTGFETIDQNDLQISSKISKNNIIYGILSGLVLTFFIYLFWQSDLINKKGSNRHVFYIGSLKKVKETVESLSSLKNINGYDENTEILLLNEKELSEISVNISSNLLNEFYNQDVIIEILNDDDDHQFMKEIVSESINHINIPIEIYENYNKPKQIGIIFGYKVSVNDTTRYLARTLGCVGNPTSGNNWAGVTGTFNSKGKFVQKISKFVEDMIKSVEYGQIRGHVIAVDENIIIINPNGLNLKKNMKINGCTKYLLNDKDENDLTDKDEDLQKLLDDIKNALEYMTNHSFEYTQNDIDEMQRMFNQYSRDSLGLISSGMSIGSFCYTLKVVDVTKSKVTTKLIDLNNPWVKIRTGDNITLE